MSTDVTTTITRARELATRCVGLKGDLDLRSDARGAPVNRAFADVPQDFDFPAWMRAHGYRVVRAPRLSPPRRMAAPTPFTCVEAMKRLIGLQDWRILTPWQLYRRLVSITHFKGEIHGKLQFKA